MQNYSQLSPQTQCLLRFLLGSLPLEVEEDPIGITPEVKRINIEIGFNSTFKDNNFSFYIDDKYVSPEINIIPKKG